MGFLTDLKENLNQGSKDKTFVLVDNLCGFTIFPLLRESLRLWPAKVFFFRATKTGLKIAFWFKMFRIISGDPIKVKNLYMNDTSDGVFSAARFDSLNSCLESQNRINQFIDRYLPEFDFYFRRVCGVGVRKEWQLWFDALLLQLNFARVLSRDASISTHRVVLISQFASLLNTLNVDPKILDGVKVCPQPFENKVQPHLWGPVIYHLGKVMLSLFRLFNPSKKKISAWSKSKSMIGVAAAWDFEGPGKKQVDDLFWWRQSTISSEQLIYMFERPECQPTTVRRARLKKLGIKFMTLDLRQLGDGASIGINYQSVSLVHSIKSLFFYSKIALRGFFGNRFARLVFSLIGWQIYKSEKYTSLYKNTNLKGVFHNDEAGLESINLAALQSNAARFGVHWSCLSAPNSSTTRCHEVYFVWGAHDLKIILDSGSLSKNILISGCFLSEGSCAEERQKGQEALKSMRNNGMRYTLALFDNSPPAPNFYRFFLQWLIEDPSLGIIIKSKGIAWDLFQKDEMGGLVQQAVDTGRIFVMGSDASPADAALLSDFSVGVTGISAIAVGALQGARVLYLDYERMDQGALKPYGLFHSLGSKRCVFYDPKSLKEAVLEYVNNPESNPSFGDVSPIIEQLDPFRDGKASQRIGEYVTWYLDSFNQNLSKSEALRLATKKYAEKWGNDKVIRCES